MAKYVVRNGYCLHLPHGRFAHPGEEVELAGDLEKDILEKQGWKVELVQPEPAIAENQEAEDKPEPEVMETPAPPRDRAVKKEAVQTK